MRAAVCLSSAVLCGLACAGPASPDAECQEPADCGARVASACGAACPTQIQRACVDGACLDLASATWPVRADVMLRSSLTGQVASLQFVFVDPRPAAGERALGCADLLPGAVAPADPQLNVVRSGFVNFAATAGTAFFPDANLGTVPEGSYLLHAVGHAAARGEGEQVAVDCLDAVDVDASLDADLALSLVPLP
jgi:hypothetical protein